jgi:L-rhamnose isomerase/sugar isomerase
MLRPARRPSSTIIECIEIGKAIGSKALTVWVGDGSNFPGQSNFTRAFERYLASMADIYKALPDDWKLFSEHKMYEPAFYSTVVQDWGTNYLIAQTLGPKAHASSTSATMRRTPTSR